MKNKIPMVPDFYKTVKKAYIQVVNISSKNTLLKISCLNPWQGSIQICARCLKLKKDYYNLNHFLNISLVKEVHLTSLPNWKNYVVDSDLTELQNSETLDVWWNKVFVAKHYPMLSSTLRVSLSIFTGSMVESWFSMMNGII